MSEGVQLPKDCVDLIQKMLHKDPTCRIKVREIIEHPFIGGSIQRESLPQILPAATLSETPINKSNTPSINTLVRCKNVFKKIHTKKNVGIRYTKKEKE